MKKLTILCTAFVLLALCGCAPGKVKVIGKLVWADGKPATELANGQVIFESPETRTSARGVIQADGTFQINTTSTDDGILPGTYNVAIVEHRPAAEGETKMPPQHLQDKYYSFSSSQLTATVNTGDTEVTLTLDRMPSKK